MNHLNSVPGKKRHSKSIDAFIIPQNDILSLEQAVAANYDDVVSFEIVKTPSLQSQRPSPYLKNDAVPASDIFPDFSLDRSQKHYQVSPDSSMQASTDNEFYIPVTLPVAPPPKHPFQSKEQANESTCIVRQLPQDASLPRKTTHPASPPEEKKPAFPPFSSVNTGVLDSAIKRLVCSEPLLSENDLFILLKEMLPDLTKHELKNALIRNGLDTDYKRFQAYMAG